MRTALFASLACLTAGSAFADIIRPEADLVEVFPGDTLRMLWLIEEASTPLFGYSIDLNPQPEDPSNPQMGSVLIDAGLTNFYQSRNVIVAGGGALHPLFTLINPDGLGGIFLSTNTADFSTILPQTGLNDVLAEIVFTISPDAMGTFIFETGIRTALSDGQGFAVSFTSLPLTIVVIPTPAPVSVLTLWAMCCTLRRR